MSYDAPIKDLQKIHNSGGGFFKIIDESLSDINLKIVRKFFQTYFQFREFTPNANKYSNWV